MRIVVVIVPMVLPTEVRVKNTLFISMGESITPESKYEMKKGKFEKSKIATG
jgi:hypothetical protein